MYTVIVQNLDPNGEVQRVPWQRRYYEKFDAQTVANIEFRDAVKGGEEIHPENPTQYTVVDVTGWLTEIWIENVQGVAVTLDRERFKEASNG
jgi:hypothetical protein